jgi:signal transduction histidine kinase/CheY-like chemotaxis protein
MSIQKEVRYLRENLVDLQRDALRIIVLFVGAVGYIWLYVTTWQLPRVGVAGSGTVRSWIGGGLLILCTSLGYALSGRHPRIATHVFVWGVLGAVASVSEVFPAGVYLFILPVIFASVLLSRLAFLLVSAVAALLTLAMSPVYMAGGEALLIPQVIFPAAMIAFVTLACWLSSRILFTTLAWAWNGYERALHNEQIARTRQAELGRALKALDEATHRLERTNYVLALARDQAEQARRFKQQFAQTISHELRTPLNLIVGFTELMAETPEYYGAHLPPAYTRDLSVVYRNACHLQSLVSDVLDLARIEAAQMVILAEETDPATLVREALETVRSVVESRHLALDDRIEDGLPALWVDPVRVRQVLYNLINNAIRVTEEGSITVTVSQQGREVIFAVADTGVGIAQEDIERIFEEFQQAGAGTRRHHGGAGLGLAISKRFVELHGGRIWAESTVDEGSTFYFGLPVERTEWDTLHGDYAPRAARAVSVTEAGESVLLAVTRSISAATLLRRYVRGCRTVVVPNREGIRQAALDLIPQAVVVDSTCEKVDDAELEILARECGLSRIPFVVAPLPGEEVLRQRLAVDGYLVKPVSRQDVWDLMRWFGENVESILVVDDDRDFVRLLGRFLEESPVRRYQVTSAYSGQQALAKIRHHQPDLLMLDLGLPDLDGTQIIRHVHSNPAWKHIPIVTVSAQEEIDRQEMLMGPVTITKAEGATPGEVVRWLQSVVDTAARPSPVVTTQAQNGGMGDRQTTTGGIP